MPNSHEWIVLGPRAFGFRAVFIEMLGEYTLAAFWECEIETIQTFSWFLKRPPLT